MVGAEDLRAARAIYLVGVNEMSPVPNDHVLIYHRFIIQEWIDLDKRVLAGGLVKAIVDLVLKGRSADHALVPQNPHIVDAKNVDYAVGYARHHFIAFIPRRILDQDLPVGGVIFIKKQLVEYRRLELSAALDLVNAVDRAYNVEIETPVDVVIVHKADA